MIELTIDNINIATDYGCRMLKGTLAELLSPASAKSVSVTDWPEVDGVDPDLANFSLAARSFELPVYAPNDTAYAALLNALKANNGVHTIGVTDTPISINTRITGLNVERQMRFYTLMVAFTEDNPNYSGTPSAGGRDLGYKLDGVPLGNYGIDVLKGTEHSVFTPSKAKRNLTIESALSGGQIYDAAGGLVLAQKSCRLRLRIIKPISNAINSYYAFLHDLTRQGSHILTATGGGLTRSFNVYYKIGRVTDCTLIQDKLWIEFEIELEQYKGYAGD